MKKLVIIVAMTALLGGAGVAGGCNHVHDEECGYNPLIEEGCTHVHTPCGVRDGSGCTYCPW